MPKNPAVTISVNGTGVEPDGHVCIYPGRSNRLVVRVSAALAGAVVRVETLAPDGRSRVKTDAFGDGRAELELGPMCAPAVYEYEAGKVYRRGYRLRIRVEQPEGGALISCFDLAAVCSQDPEAEWLAPGAAERCVYNDGYYPEDGVWNPFGSSAAGMQPALQLRLDPAVLADRDRVVVLYRSRPDPAVGPMKGLLRVRDEAGDTVVPDRTVEVDSAWAQWRADVSGWKSGVYTVELLPVLAGVVWEDGPVLRYRREEADPGRVRVSPYAPFSLRRDEGREVVEIREWPKSLPHGWELGGGADEGVLYCNGDPDTEPVALKPELSGTYAVFVDAVNAALMRVGEERLIRRVQEPEREDFGPVFVSAVEMSGQGIELYANDLESVRRALGEQRITGTRIRKLVRKRWGEDDQGDPRYGVRRLVLVPVTSSSVQAFRAQTSELPFELRAVDDWWCYFRGWDRTDQGQLDTIIAGQRELGIASMNWAVGRSWVQYPTRLPAASSFPCAPITADLLQSTHPHFAAWQRIVGCCDTLAYPLERRKEHGARLYGWLAMNRHYGPDSYGGVFTSAWARSHPEFRQHHKDLTTVDVSRMEFFFPEVRRERLDILEEVAGYGPDGIVVGCCRQSPMAGYNPEMVAAYKAETGVDPTDIDIEDGQPYLDWIQWRAEFFTTMLRELAERLEPIEAKLGRRIPVVARVPGVGLLWNLAEGMDVRGWVSEGLIDELQLDPLDCAAGRADHDVRPYLELCRPYGVPVFGGVNGTTGADCGVEMTGVECLTFGENYTPVVGLRRAVGLLKAGVDGIEIYEAEVFARSCERRWLIPLWGRPELAETWLAESNLDAVFPVTARNAALGHDNHWFGGETLHGAHGMPRGAKRAL